MPSPDPTYDAGLVLVDQPLTHPSTGHVAHLTFACADTAAQTAQTLADNFQDNFNIAFQPFVDSAVTIEKPTVLRGDGTTTPAVAVASAVTVMGGAPIDGPSPQVCALFKKITALGGRGNRGRTYFPYLLADDAIHEDGSISLGTLVDDLNDAAANFHAGLVGNDMPMVICNRHHAANPTPPPDTYVDAYHTGATVTQYFLEVKVATQRRRLVRS